MQISVEVCKIVLAYQELCLHSFKGLLFGDVPHNMVLVDESEGIADGYGLLQPLRPAECMLLHLSEAAVYHWQNALQVRLQTDTAI